MGIKLYIFISDFEICRIENKKILMELDIYFVRHGLSCANVVDMTSTNKFKKLFHLKPKNPALANYANYQNEDFHNARLRHGHRGYLMKLIEKADGWYSSDMLRAIETAQMIFPSVEVLPYVSEKSFWRRFDKENQPQTPK